MTLHAPRQVRTKLPTLETGESLTVIAAAPGARPEGGVLGACHHTSRPVHDLQDWARAVAGTSDLILSSAWLNEYRLGDYVALHTDRPDCVITGLIAVTPTPDPVTLCTGLVGMSSLELAELARINGFPAGDDTVLAPDVLLLFNGAAVPHHRRPATQICSVLTLTYRPHTRHPTP